MITFRTGVMVMSLVLGIQAVAPNSFDAQIFKRKNKKEAAENGNKSDVKSISKITKDAEQFEGLFTMYRDTVTGESWMAIPEESLKKEFIYFSQVEDGVLQTGNFRGSYRSSKIITFHKHFDRIEVRQENTSFYFNPESPLARYRSRNAL